MIRQDILRGIALPEDVEQIEIVSNDMFVDIVDLDTGEVIIYFILH